VFSLSGLLFYITDVKVKKKNKKTKDRTYCVYFTHIVMLLTIYPFSFTDNLVHVSGLTDNHIFIKGLIHLVIAYI